MRKPGRVISLSHHVFTVEETDRGVIGPGHRENDVSALLPSSFIKALDSQQWGRAQ